MSSQGSVTHWIGLLKAGDPDAAQPLWQVYFHRLVNLARVKLRGASRRVADEEDVALSAFDSFCRAARRGRFPRLNDRDDLWQLLVLITVRKAADLVHHERRVSRGGGRVLTLSDLASPDLERILGPEPTPALAAQVADEYRRLLEHLGDAELQAVALLKMEGDTTAEIAAKLGCVPRTVERRLRLIRRIWAEDAPHEPGPDAEG